MKKNKFTPDELDRILDSLNGMKPAEMPVFFHTRLMAAMDAKHESATGFWKLVTKPSVSLITLSLLVVLNIASVSYFLHQPAQTASSAVSGLQSFAEEYGLGTNTIFSTEKMKP
ncbi:MAG: hypothetical protein RLZZ28_668 [Bacteroidota bacterium]|jgi:hypothetical protein